jgi:hypothetical protein
MGFNRRKLEDQRREESEVQSKVRSRRSTPVQGRHTQQEQALPH